MTAPIEQNLDTTPEKIVGKTAEEALAALGGNTELKIKDIGEFYTELKEKAPEIADFFSRLTPETTKAFVDVLKNHTQA